MKADIKVVPATMDDLKREGLNPDNWIDLGKGCFASKSAFDKLRKQLYMQSLEDSERTDQDALWF